MVLCLGLALVLLGCREKTDANSALEQAAKTLAKAEPDQPTPPASAPAPAAAQPAPETPVPEAQPSAPPAEQMSQAMMDYKAGKLEDAVTRLQKLRATPNMTPQKRIALNDAMAAVMTEIYSLAAKGDTRAIQAVMQYEKMQSQPR